MITKEQMVKFVKTHSLVGMIFMIDDKPKKVVSDAGERAILDDGSSFPVRALYIDLVEQLVVQLWPDLTAEE